MLTENRFAARHPSWEQRFREALLRMRVLGINAVFHDPAAALVVDGDSSRPPRRSASAAASTARRRCRSPPGSCRSRRRAGAWATPGLDAARPRRGRLLVRPGAGPPTSAPTSPPTSGRVCGRCTRSARPPFLADGAAGPGPGRVRFVAHHVAHAASAASPRRMRRRAVLVLDGRGERDLAPRRALREDGALEVLATQELPHSLGLLYEELTDHLGFRRSSDEYKVMALASYGRARLPRRPPPARHATGRRRLRRRAGRLGALRSAAAAGGDDWTSRHADLAATVQRRLEEVAARARPWLHDAHGRVGARDGGRRGAELRRQLAPGASGPVRRRLGAARRRRRGHRARRGAARRRTSSATGWRRCATAALGRGWSDDELARLARRRRRRPRAPRRPRRRGGRGARRRRRRRVVPGPQRVRPAGARAPQPARRPAPAETTWRGSTTSRAASSSGRWRRWCCRAGGGDLRRPAAEPVHALHPRGARRAGATASPPSCTSTARPASRPSTARTSRSWRAVLERFEARTGRARRRQHDASTRPGARWSTTRATRWSASDPRRSTLLAIGPFLVRRPDRPPPGRRRRRSARGDASRRSRSSSRPWAAPRSGGCSTRSVPRASHA